MSKKIVIFDLDGTLVPILPKGEKSPINIGGGKIDWDFFFNPSNVKTLDVPNTISNHYVKLSKNKVSKSSYLVVD